MKRLSLAQRPQSRVETGSVFFQFDPASCGWPITISNALAVAPAAAAAAELAHFEIVRSSPHALQERANCTARCLHSRRQPCSTYRRQRSRFSPRLIAIHFPVPQSQMLNRPPPAGSIQIRERRPRAAWPSRIREGPQDSRPAALWRREREDAVSQNDRSPAAEHVRAAFAAYRLSRGAGSE